MAPPPPPDKNHHNSVNFYPIFVIQRPLSASEEYLHSRVFILHKEIFFFSTSFSYPLKNSAGTFGLEWKVVLQPYGHTLLTSSHTFPIWFPLFSWGYSIIYPIFPGLQGHQESPPTEPSQSGSHHRRGHIMWPPQHSHNMWPPCTATT